MNVQFLSRKGISLLLILAMTLQSCNVYYKTPVTFKDAAAADRKILMKRQNGERMRLYRIERRQDSYYGITKRNGQQVAFPLDTTDIKSVRIRNNRASTAGTVVLSVLSLGVVALIAFAISWSNSWDSVDVEIDH